MLTPSMFTSSNHELLCLYSPRKQHGWAEEIFASEVSISKSFFSCMQLGSLVVLPRRAIPGEMRFNLMHCSNSTVGENVSKTKQNFGTLINYSVLEKSLTFGYCHAISVAKWSINGLNLFIGQFFARLSYFTIHTRAKINFFRIYQEFDV